MNPWTILRKRTKDVPPGFRRAAGRQYQVFEIVVAEVAKLLERDYTWRVSPEQADGGIDFVGERILFDLPKLDLRYQSIIVGQCKARDQARGRGALDEFGADPVKMFRTVKRRYHTRPALLMFVTSRRLTQRDRRNAAAGIMDGFGAPSLYLGLDELESIIGAHLDALLPLFERYLTGAERTCVLQYFQRRRNSSPVKVSVHVGRVPDGETGQAFIVPITVSLDGVVPDDLVVLWRWRHRRTAELMREITPVGVASPAGARLPRTNALRRTVQLKLIGYSAGTHDLGSIEVRYGTRAAKASLGTVTLADAYHPQFFREPYTDILSRFDSWLSRAEAGNAQTIMVTGVGGSGKTRLCTEFSIEAERRGARCISVSHPQSADDPYRVITALLHALAATEDPAADPYENLIGYLRKHHPSLLKRVQGAVSALFQARAGHELNLGAITNVLVALLLGRTATEMLFVHMSDLHWAHADVLQVFRAALDRIRGLHADRTATVAFKPRLILVAEGRRMETHPRRTGSTLDGYSTVAWEAFTRKTADPEHEHVVVVTPFSTVQTGKFLQALFENTEATESRVPKRLIPHQKALITGLLQRADGSPLFIIEYIRLLRARGYLASVASTGLVYLCRLIDDSLKQPEAVEALIQHRLAYVQKDDPALAKLIRAVAFIKDRVSAPLFEELRARFAPHVTASALAATDFLTLPAKRTGDVTFRHESYYHSIAATDLSFHDREDISSAYLEWLGKRPLNDAALELDHALVLAQLPAPDRAQIEETLERALHVAETARQDLLVGRILEHLVPLFPATHDEQRRIAPAEYLRLTGYRARLARFYTDTARWVHGQEQVSELIASLSAVSESGWRATAAERERVVIHAAEAHVQLANVELHLLRHDLAIELTRTFLSAAETRRFSAAPERKRWEQICAEAWNRLAVALWFDGQHEAALKILEKGTGVARARRDEDYPYWLTDLGAAQIRQRPRKALELLSDAVNFCPDDGSRGLAKYERAMAELVAIERGRGTAASRSRKVADVLGMMELVYEEAIDRGYTNNEGGAALVAGVCSALLERDDAPEWLMRVVNVAARERHYEFLWKAHLNLAQIAHASKILRLGSELHAQEAERILRADLERRTAATAVYRMALLALPLAQLVRIWEGRKPSRAAALLRDFPAVAGYFDKGRSMRNDRRVVAPIVHVAHGPADYFLIS